MSLSPYFKRKRSVTHRYYTAVFFLFSELVLLKGNFLFHSYISSFYLLVIFNNNLFQCNFPGTALKLGYILLIRRFISVSECTHTSKPALWTADTFHLCLGAQGYCLIKRFWVCGQGLFLRQFKITHLLKLSKTTRTAKNLNYLLNCK